MTFPVGCRLSRGLGLGLALVLAACGSRTELRPPPGHSLPVAPLGRSERLSAEELLTRPPQLAPERSLELRRRSEEREDDPFDLPPEEGGIVAPPVAGPVGPCRETAQREGRSMQLAECGSAAPAQAG